MNENNGKGTFPKNISGSGKVKELFDYYYASNISSRSNFDQIGDCVKNFLASKIATTQFRMELLKEFHELYEPYETVSSASPMFASLCLEVFKLLRMEFPEYLREIVKEAELRNAQKAELRKSLLPFYQKFGINHDPQEAAESFIGSKGESEIALISDLLSSEDKLIKFGEGPGFLNFLRAVRAEADELCHSPQPNHEKDPLLL
jgi:hypothetical protein